MRTRNVAARYRREAIAAQRAAAGAHAWLSGRIERGANQSDLKCDQAYVAHLYEQARACVADISCLEHRA